MQKEKEKRTTPPTSTRGLPREPKRPRDWPSYPPTQPSGKLWPTPIPSSTIDIGEIRRMLLQILGRLDAIERRLNDIERILAKQPLTP